MHLFRCIGLGQNRDQTFLPKPAWRSDTTSSPGNCTAWSTGIRSMLSAKACAIARLRAGGYSLSLAVRYRPNSSFPMLVFPIVLKTECSATRSASMGSPTYIKSVGFGDSDPRDPWVTRSRLTPGSCCSNAVMANRQIVAHPSFVGSAGCSTKPAPAHDRSEAKCLKDEKKERRPKDDLGEFTQAKGIHPPRVLFISHSTWSFSAGVAINGDCAGLAPRFTRWAANHGDYISLANCTEPELSRLLFHQVSTVGINHNVNAHRVERETREVVGGQDSTVNRQAVCVHWRNAGSIFPFQRDAGRTSASIAL